jgi:anthranilate phosphoribosyltransferase
VHQLAAQLLQQPHAAVLKGDGGETERNPDVECLVQSVHNGVLSDEIWPALFARRHVKPEQLDPKQLALVWQGEVEDEYAEAAVIGTAAVALKLLGKASTQLEAQALAGDFWRGRNGVITSAT